MNPDVLVSSFGAISTGSIALVFAFKWVLDGRRVFDLAWAGGLACYAIGIGCVTAQTAFGAIWAGHMASLLFWTFSALMIMGNLAFIGRPVPWFGLLVVAAVLTAFSIGFHLTERPEGFAFFGAVTAVLYFWTGWLLRRLPSIGKVAFGIFALRAAFALTRILFVGTPYLIVYSIASFSLNFLVGLTLLAGSLFHSRLLLMASREELRRSNDALTAHETELQESNRLLEEQAMRLERLGSDYAAALRRAEQANRAKDSFIANMNHEFRTPLNAVLGFTELIQVEAQRGGHARISEYAGFAYEGGRSMLRNVDRILAFVALDSGHRPVRDALFDPRAAIAIECDALAAAAVKKAITVSRALTLAPELWRGDESAFRAIVDELLRNALKAAPQGSEVLVELTGGDGELMLRIVDCGPGLSDKFLRTVGDLFNISEHVLSRGGAVQGVGLGLSIAARYARLMGGALTLERNKPNGTIARVFLSRTEWAPQKESQPQASETKPVVAARSA